MAYCVTTQMSDERDEVPTVWGPFDTKRQAAKWARDDRHHMGQLADDKSEVFVELCDDDGPDVLLYGEFQWRIEKMKKPTKHGPVK